MSKHLALVLIISGLLLGCNRSSSNTELAQTVNSTSDLPFKAIKLVSFDEPWAMTFLPDGRLLVTEKKGTLKVFNPVTKTTQNISGLPRVMYGGQGGLGDIVLHPQFAKNKLVYLSYVEASTGGRGAVVTRAMLSLNKDGTGQLSNLQPIWRQIPKVSGDGHFGHRIAFDHTGMLWISSGERQKFNPAQDMNSNLGKLIRLYDDGRIPADNPFTKQGDVTAQIWTLGHRNPLGIAFNAQGQLWEIEMGPQGGDELNLITKGQNYGYPIVSNGDHYDGTPIPDHVTRPEFKAPVVSWTPVISPSSLMFYSGKQFPAWQGNAFVGGLSSEALIRIEFKGDQAREAERFAMNARIRDVKQAPDGSLWLLEDGQKANLIQLVARQ